MSQKLEQINVTYVPTEDRILLRLGTEGETPLTFWLTRRFVTVLWKALLERLGRDPALAKDAVTDKVRDAVLGMEHAEALQGSDFATPFKADKSPDRSKTAQVPKTAPTPKDGKLVIGGAVHPRARMATKLDLKCDDGKTYSLNLNKQLLHALMHLLSQTARSGEWKLELSVGDSAVILPQGDVGLH